MSPRPAAGRRPFTALVLAASRGAADPVAQAEGLSHKCLVDTGGTPMLLRVLETLEASPSVGRIAISIEDASLLDSLPGLASALAEGTLMALPSAGSPSQSVLQALDSLAEPWPLLITTADNPLLQPEMVEHFCGAARLRGVDILAAVASEEVIRQDFPEAQRTFLKFRDGRFSGCNLFALTGPGGLEAVRIWNEAGRHRKRPWRLVASFGPLSLLLFVFGLLTLEEAIDRAAAAMKLRAAVVRMPFATAAIDVDKPADLALVRKILAARED